jgi:hypothetical protein
LSVASVAAAVGAVTGVAMYLARDRQDAARDAGASGHLVGLGLSLLATVAIATSTVAVVRISRHLYLSRIVVRVEAILALTVAAAAVTVTGAIAAWSVEVARIAPGILFGSNAGLFGLPGGVVVVGGAVLMFAGFAAAAEGGGRVYRALRSASPGVGAGNAGPGPVPGPVPPSS